MRTSSKKKGSGRLESFQNSPLKCISFEDRGITPRKEWTPPTKTRFATPKFTSTPQMKMTPPNKPFTSIFTPQEQLSPILKSIKPDFAKPSPLLTSPAGQFNTFGKGVISPAVNSDVPFTFNLTGESSNDSETTHSETENTCGSIDFSDMFQSKRNETPPAPGMLLTQKHTPSLLASPSPNQKKPLSVLRKTPTPSGNDDMDLDFLFGAPTENPVPTPPTPRTPNQNKLMASLNPTHRTPAKKRNLAPPKKGPGDQLSPNTLFKKPMEDLVGELQKLMSNTKGPRPPPPNVNKSRKRGRVNTKVSFLEAQKAQEMEDKSKKMKKLEQKPQETRKQRRESTVATPPQYETQKICKLPMQKMQIEFECSEKPEVTIETPPKRKKKVPKKREVTPEPQPAEKRDLEKKCIAGAAKSKKRKRTPSVRKYNFRFKRRKPNSPCQEEAKFDTITHVQTPLRFASKLHIDLKRWDEVVSNILSEAVGQSRPTVIEIPIKAKFRNFTDGMFGDRVHSQELYSKEPNLFILHEDTQDVITKEQRFANCIRMIRTDNDHRLIQNKLNDKNSAQRIQQAFADLPRFCNQEGGAPVRNRSYSNFNFPDQSTVDLGNIKDGIQVIFGENNLSGVNSPKRHLSMVGSVTPLHEGCLQLGSLHYNRGPCPLYICVIQKTPENDKKLRKLCDRGDITLNRHEGLHGFMHPKLLEDEGITFEHGLLQSGHMIVLPCGSVFQTLAIGFTVWESIAVCGNHWFEMFTEHAANLSLHFTEMQNFAYPQECNIFTKPGREQIVEYWKNKLRSWKPSENDSAKDGILSLTKGALKSFWAKYESTESFQRRISIFPFPRNFITRFHVFRFQTNRPLKVNAHITLNNGFCTLWDNQEEWKSLSVTTNFDDHMIAYCVWVIRNKAVAKLADKREEWDNRMNGSTTETDGSFPERKSADVHITDEDVYPWAVQLYPHEITNLHKFML